MHFAFLCTSPDGVCYRKSFPLCEHGNLWLRWKLWCEYKSERVCPLLLLQLNLQSSHNLLGSSKKYPSLRQTCFPVPTERCWKNTYCCSSISLWVYGCGTKRLLPLLRWNYGRVMLWNCSPEQAVSHLPLHLPQEKGKPMFWFMIELRGHVLTHKILSLSLPARCFLDWKYGSSSRDVRAIQAISPGI